MSRHMVTALALLLLVHECASGQVDAIDVYFDEGAELYCIESHPMSLVMAYVVYSNPSVAEIVGYDFGVAIDQYHSSGPPLVISLTSPCAESISDLDQVSIRCSTPITCGRHTTLCTMQMLFQGGITRFRVTGAATPSLPLDGPFVVLAGDKGLVLEEGEGSSFIDGGYDRCVGLPTEKTSWGAIKLLHRP